MIFGVDVSRWQGAFDFNKAKAEGVQFVILKAGGADDGLYTDSMFVRNYNAARAAGLAVGVYYFADAYSTAEAENQLAHFLSIIRGKMFEYPVAIDVEANMASQPKGKLDGIMKTMLNGLENAGYWAAWYAGLEVYYWHIDGAAMATRYAWWLPYWGATKPNLPNIGIWQFGGSTNYIRSNKVAGVVCDQNYSYRDYPSLIKERGKNGYPKTTPKAPEQAAPKKTLKVGAKIKINNGAKVYGTNKKFASFVYNNTFVVREINGKRVVFAPKATGDVTGAVNADNITLV